MLTAPCLADRAVLVNRDERLRRLCRKNKGNGLIIEALLPVRWCGNRLVVGNEDREKGQDNRSDLRDKRPYARHNDQQGEAHHAYRHGEDVRP